MCLANTENKKPSLLLLSGFLYDKRIWNNLCHKLHHQFLCISWDMNAIQSLDLDSMIDKMVNHLPNHFYLCGWSIGGILALYIAKKYPSRVKGIITIATNPCFTQQDAWPGVNRLEVDSLHTQFHKQPRLALHVFMALQMLGVAKRQGTLIHLTSNLLKDISASSLDFIFKQILTLNLISVLEHTDIPTECVFFKKDRLVPWQVSQHIASHNNAAVRISVLPNTGHGSLVTSFDYIAEKLGAML